MDSILKTAIANLKSKIDTSSTTTKENSAFNKQKINYLVPLMYRQWASHCTYPNFVTATIFITHSNEGCQLLSNKTDKLLLNIALNRPEDYETLCKFKKHRFYNLFKGDGEIYELEFGEISDAAIQITSEILTDVFNIPTNRDIPTIFEIWD